MKMRRCFVFLFIIAICVSLIGCETKTGQVQNDIERDENAEQDEVNDNDDSESTDKGDSESTDKGDSESTDKGDSESTDKEDSESTDKGDSESTDKGDSESTDKDNSESAGNENTDKGESSEQQGTKEEEKSPETKFTCANCKKGVVSKEGDYCSNCKCELCQELKMDDTHKYCSKHNCKANECKNAAVKNFSYCSTHKCGHSNCGRTARTGLPYCYSHSCQVSGCKNIRTESGTSCSFHENNFQNPISTTSAADPYIQYIDGYYYALYTEGTKITLYRNTSLDKVLTGERKVVFSIGDKVQGNVWAPELHYVPSTGKWYIYASGSTNGDEFGTIRMFCLESVGSNPFDTYVFKGFTDADTLAIDQTVFYDEASRTLYTAYSQFTDKGQVITLAIMENPWTISDKRIEISYPQYEWEKMGAGAGKDERVNEGPIFLYRNGKLFLIYSASGCWSQYYCLGMLEYVGNDFTKEEMMDLSNWKKSASSVFSAANGVYGVGHCSFFYSPDGTETWIAYHGMSTPDAGEGGRYMYVQPISFDQNGRPILGEPLSRDTYIQIPSR